MVVSGAPEKEQNHAEKVCDMALDMIEAITDLKDPSTGWYHLSRRFSIVLYLSYSLRIAFADTSWCPLWCCCGGHRRAQDASLLSVW